MQIFMVIIGNGRKNKVICLKLIIIDICFKVLLLVFLRDDLKIQFIYTVETNYNSKREETRLKKII